MSSSSAQVSPALSSAAAGASPDPDAEAANIDQLKADLFDARAWRGKKDQACDECRRRRRKCVRDDESTPAAKCRDCRNLGRECTRNDQIFKPGRLAPHEYALISRVGSSGVRELRNQREF